MFPVTGMRGLIVSGRLRTDTRCASAAWNHLEALRPHHWIKNLLVFLPLVVAHHLYDLYRVERCAAVFVAFSLCASAVYLMNDLLDIEADRLHPQKRLRPLASGRISPTAALIELSLLLAAAGLAASLISWSVAGVLAAYFVLIGLYSFGAKRVPILDVILLACGYALRVVAGSLAAGLVPEAWLLAFCVSLFFSLALIKRYAELIASVQGGGAHAHALGYSRRDGAVMLALGSASGYLAVLILALDTTAGLAGAPGESRASAWITCALLFFWVSHLWLMAHRGSIREDPVLYAIKHCMSLIPLLLIVLVCLLRP